MRFAGLMDMLLFCAYIGCVFVFLLVVLPQAVYLFLYVNVFNGAVGFVFLFFGVVWCANQVRKMVK